MLNKLENLHKKIFPTFWRWFGVSAFLILFSFPSVSSAMTVQQCLLYNLGWGGNGSTAGFTGTGDYTYAETYNQVYPYENAHLDCLSNQIYPPVVSILAVDRSYINFLPDSYFSSGNLMGNWLIYDDSQNVISSGYGDYYLHIDSLSDGSYYLDYTTTTSSDNYDMIPFYVVGGKYYLSLSDVTSSSSGTSPYSYLDWLIVQLVVIFCLSFIPLRFFFSTFYNKKSI